MFAVCDTCGATAMCYDLGEDTHICEACDWAPKIEAERKQMRATIATLTNNQALLVEMLKKLWFIVPNGYKSEITAKLSEIKNHE
jgi:acetyl-CoA carboxylase beta subunit